MGNASCSFTASFRFSVFGCRKIAVESDRTTGLCVYQRRMASKSHGNEFDFIFPRPGLSWWNSASALPLHILRCIVQKPIHHRRKVGGETHLTSARRITTRSQCHAPRHDPDNATRCRLLTGIRIRVEKFRGRKIERNAERQIFLPQNFSTAMVD